PSYNNKLIIYNKIFFIQKGAVPKKYPVTLQSDTGLTIYDAISM
ncbi:MAG: hypothetical protein PWP31_1005, partial [Clostridia bacterium]|nr:hypothetical protein [Clostridia bacterium]